MKYSLSVAHCASIGSPSQANFQPLLDEFEKVKNTPLGRLANCATDPVRMAEPRANHHQQTVSNYKIRDSTMNKEYRQPTKQDLSRRFRLGRKQYT